MISRRLRAFGHRCTSQGEKQHQDYCAGNKKEHILLLTLPSCLGNGYRPYSMAQYNNYRLLA